MSFRFQKRIGLGPFSINLSKGGVSVSAGVRGAHVNMDLSGRRKNPRVTLGIPGTGLSYSTTIGKSSPTPPPLPSSRPALPTATATTFPPETMQRLSPRQRLLVAVKDHSLPLRDRGEAYRQWCAYDDARRWNEPLAYCGCVDAVMRGDCMSFEDRLRMRATFVMEELRLRNDPDATKYTIETAIEALRADFADEVRMHEQEKPLDTTPLDMAELRPYLAPTRAPAPTGGQTIGEWIVYATFALIALSVIGNLFH
jgi:hypothetical protein